MANTNLNNFFISFLSIIEENSYVDRSIQDNVCIANIRSNIHKFLIDNCLHNIEIDYIDVTPEQTTKIVYCTKCLMNF